MVKFYVFLQLGVDEVNASCNRVASGGEQRPRVPELAVTEHSIGRTRFKSNSCTRIMGTAVTFHMHRFLYFSWSGEGPGIFVSTDGMPYVFSKFGCTLIYCYFFSSYDICLRRPATCCSSTQNILLPNSKNLNILFEYPPEVRSTTERRAAASGCSNNVL